MESSKTQARPQEIRSVGEAIWKGLTHWFSVAAILYTIYRVFFRPAFDPATTAALIGLTATIVVAHIAYRLGQLKRQE